VIHVDEVAVVDGVVQVFDDVEKDFVKKTISWAICHCDHQD